ncbi:leucyl/phenylalanyl-tRNA--protein transferase [Pseudemcibacter sp.]|uniref:leucyl/phenylalanyl-tRNA--protein transferase n=1 Tax=Pseudemcibacter sp. TaxID=2943293 RepID=UPI0023206A85|nr:leucyl/phenylalanyl-tRNA--protein transferase [Kordiimonadaceae bacterium]MDA9553543.1 leucyl/phenylalanyl-tRNA--protein transferase [Emcibacteraceae bacterium]
MNITPELLLSAYMQGIFPMAESADSDDVFWVDPDERGIFPLDQFHVPKKLAKKIKSEPFKVRINTAFQEVMLKCAEPTDNVDRQNTWINKTILTRYNELHEMGYAHSVECWQDQDLVGGLYGVSLNGAFCGESMFHTVTDASKIALVYLVARLKVGGYRLLDTQFVTDQLSQFGAIEISRKEYRARLKEALLVEDSNFYSMSEEADGSTILQSVTQTS